MNPALTCALIIARMALRDGVLDATERAFLEEMCETLVGTPVEEVIEMAHDTPLEQLVEGLDLYEDRFFIAARAHMMAFVDDDYDAREVAFFEELISALEITSDDRTLIESLAAIEGPINAPPPRLLDLYNKSSFYRADEVASPVAG